MSILERTLDMFNDVDETSTIKQDFLLLFASTEKVRRGVYAKVTELKKENAALKAEIELIKKHINLEEPHEESDFSDLPLLQLCKR